MRTTAWTIAAMTFLTAAAGGDTVFLRNGNIHEGTVLEATEEHVRIRPAGGGDVLTIPRDKVLFVRQSGGGDGGGDGLAPPDGDEGGASGEAVPVGGAALEGLPQGGFDPAKATLPQSFVFHLLRRMEQTPAGAERRRLREQLEQWRIYAHDERRRRGTRWLTIDQAAKLREGFAQTLETAEDRLSKFRTYRGWKERKVRRNRKQWQAAMAKLREAAEYWPDARLRDFLMGIAHLQAENYENAADAFARCREDFPFVAGFLQGHAAALLELEQYDRALRELVRVFRLWPGSVEAMRLLTEAMKATPGAMTDNAAYMQAEALLDRYVDPGKQRRYSRRGTTWLMPGERPWHTHTRELLPTPPYDRLVVRQGVAVPVGKHLLMVDADVVGEQKKTLVRLGAGHIVAGRTRRQSLRTRDRGAPALAFIEVGGYAFRPLPRALDKPPGRDTRVTLYGIDFYAEMGRAVRQVHTTVRGASGGGLELDKGLLPGESAGPIITADGALVGVIAGRTDHTSEGGGPAEPIAAEHIQAVLEGAERGSSSYVRYGRVDRKPDAPDREVTGRAFVVYVVKPERLGK